MSVVPILQPIVLIVCGITAAILLFSKLPVIVAKWGGSENPRAKAEAARQGIDVAFAVGLLVAAGVWFPQIAGAFGVR